MRNLESVRPRGRRESFPSFHRIAAPSFLRQFTSSIKVKRERGERASKGVRRVPLFYSLHSLVLPTYTVAESALGLLERIKRAADGRSCVSSISGRGRITNPFLATTAASKRATRLMVNEWMRRHCDTTHERGRPASKGIPWKRKKDQTKLLSVSPSPFHYRNEDKN